MSRKFVGIDYHSSTTSQIEVQDEDGTSLWETPLTVRSQPDALISAVKAVPGEVEVLFEATTGSAWLKNLLKPHVERVRVCHAADNERSRGNKTDRRDAKDLAKRLRTKDFTEVYQGPEVSSNLREWVRQYLRNTGKVVRVKNQIKAVFRKEGKQSGSTNFYDETHRAGWIKSLSSEALKISVRDLYKQLDLVEEQKDNIEARMVQTARSRKGWESIMSLPGFGKIRVAKVMGMIGTPYRFPSKRQLWRYSCLAVVVHDSTQWVSKGPDGPKIHREQNTRGLNTDGRSELKEIFKGAAHTAIRHYPEVKADFEARLRDKNPSKAKLDIARKLASQLLTLWKRKEVYRAEKARWKDYSAVG